MRGIGGVEQGQEIDGWAGTASELLSLLTKGVSKGVASSSRWPKSPWLHSNELRRIAPQLRMNGISVTYERNREKRLLTLRTTNCG